VRELVTGELLRGDRPGLFRVATGPPSDRDWRTALAGPAGARFALSDRLPPHARLDLALAALAGPQGGGPVRAEIRVASADSAPATVVEGLDLPTDGSAGWRELSVDLSRWSGKTVRLELASSQIESAGSWVAFGNPRIVSARPSARHDERPPIILISIDTLRADRLGCYGYTSHPTSPEIDRRATSATRFTTSISQAPWTRPSHRAMLNGLNPISNGNLYSPRLGEMLWRAGYHTVAITAGGQLDPEFEFDAGFERFRIWDWIHAPDTVLPYLIDDGRPFFLFLHTYEVHEPYTDHRFTAGLPRGRLGEDFRKAHWKWLGNSMTDEERAYASALYDGDVANMDDGVGGLFAELQRSGVLDRAIVVLTSDHGEQFWEHGTWGHGGDVYDEEIHVPLLVWLPKRLAQQRIGGPPPEVIREQVRTIDLYPTLLDLAGVPLDHEVQGRDLLPLLARKEGWDPTEALSEATSGKFERKSLRSQRSKFILSARTAEWPGGDSRQIELFDLSRDPGELENRASRHPDVVDALLAHLLRLAAGTSGHEEEVPPDLDPELTARLRALGYLGN